MSLQKKIVVLFLVLGLVFSLGSYAGLSAFVLPAFEDFEQQSARESLARVRKALDDAIQSALTDAKSPEAALKDAQSTANRLLRAYR